MRQIGQGLAVVTGALVLSLGSGAAALEKVSFGTNWLAQAEHGGFYQAVADGTYAACGLDVTVLAGGPQVNNRALMLAGRIQFNMGGDMLEAFSAVQENVPLKSIAAIFQKHPQVILAHPGEAKTFEDLKKMRLLIGDGGYAGYYQWMIKAWGFTPEQRDVYTFNPAPFIADKAVAMQGYLTSEPYEVARVGGFEPQVFLIADAGFSTYSTTIETMDETLKKPEVVKCFVEGSIKGWYNYLYGDNAKANEMIKADNPDMTDGQIAYSIAKMKEFGIVDSGDAEKLGIGAMTEEKVKDFFDKMVAAGVLKGDIDWKASFTTEYVNKGVGLDLKK